MPPFPPPDYDDFPLVPSRPYPSVNTKSATGNSPGNLGSHDNHQPMVSDVTLYVIVGCSAAIVTALIVLLGYKVRSKVTNEFLYFCYAIGVRPLPPHVVNLAFRPASELHMSRHNAFLPQTCNQA